MARKTRKKQSTATNPMPILIGGIVAIAIIALGYWYLTHGGSNKNYKPLPLQTYVNNPNSLRGSSFSVTGEVVAKPRVNHETQIIEIAVTQKGVTEHVMIEVPTKVKGPNIDPKQNYIFNVKVAPNGWLIVSSYKDK